MNNSLYYKHLFILLICIGFSIYLSIKFFTGSTFHNVEKAAPGFKEFLLKYGKQTTLVMYLVVMIFNISLIVTGIPTLKDIPNVIQNKYESISGESLSDSITGKTRITTRRIFLFDEKTKQKIGISFYGRYDIKKGDDVELYYYPHSKIGSYQDDETNKMKK